MRSGEWSLGRKHPLILVKKAELPDRRAIRPAGPGLLRLLLAGLTLFPLIALGHPGHKNPKYEPVDFLVVEDFRGALVLKTALADYEIDGNRITLVGLIHVAEDDYVRELAALLEECEAAVLPGRASKKMELLARELGVAMVLPSLSGRNPALPLLLSSTTRTKIPGDSSMERRRNFLAASMEDASVLAPLAGHGCRQSRGTEDPMAAIHRQLVAGAHRVAVLLEASSAASLEHRLISQGFRRQEVRYLTAWRVPAKAPDTGSASGVPGPGRINEQKSSHSNPALPDK